MELTKEIVQGLVVLLPGFVTVGVSRALYVGEPENDFDKVVKSLVFTFVNYVIFSFFVWLKWRYELRSSHMRKGGEVSIANIDIYGALPAQPGDLVALFLIAVAVGIVIAFYKTNDGHKWLLRRCGVTRRTTRHNVWHDVFSDFGQNYVIVNLEDERRLYGWPLHYNDDASEPFLFLSQAEWLSIDENGQEVQTPAGDVGIMLLPGTKVASVEFLAPAQEPQAENFITRIKEWWRTRKTRKLRKTQGDGHAKSEDITGIAKPGDGADTGTRI